MRWQDKITEGLLRIAIVMGVDRFLDMLRTSLNVSGDAMVTIVVNKTEKKINEVV